MPQMSPMFWTTLMMFFLMMMFMCMYMMYFNYSKKMTEKKTKILKNMNWTW